MIFCAHELEILILLKFCTAHSNLQINEIPTLKKSNCIFFHRNRRNKKILKFMWNHKNSKAKLILRKTSKARVISLPDFKLYYRAILVKIV